MNSVRKEDASMSSEEMLERSTSWTLACDNALLNRLKSFSETLTRNSQDISQECDGLSKDIARLDYRLKNINNEFLMLSNAQFVENRVEEFEEFSASLSSASNVTTASKTKAEKEAELISKMKQAIQLGLKACNNHRQEKQNGRQFWSKTPHLIGSPKFFSSNYCGLVDESLPVLSPYDNFPEADSVSMSSSSQAPDTNAILQPDVGSKPAAPTSQVQFTMPPTPAFPVVLSDSTNPPHQATGAEGRHDAFGNNEESGYYGRNEAGRIPPSPTISDRSGSDMGKSVAGASRENVPRSVTDELNKIYQSFAPPPNVVEDSDDDFRPSASTARLFADDDDDDIFGEKELFPSSRKSTDFFGRSNQTNIPAPVLSVPPPFTPEPQQQHSKQPPPFNEVQTIAGPKPTKDANDTRNMKSGSFDGASGVSKEVIVSDENKKLHDDRVPETEGPATRTKLPPGAVSIFGGLPPPVFNSSGSLQPAQATRTERTSSLSSSQRSSTQISAPQNHVATHSYDPTTTVEAVKGNRTEAGAARTQEDVNQPNTIITSQPSRVSSASSGRRENISQASSKEFRDTSRASGKVPASSLFADDSSDDDIFLSSKTLQQKSSSSTVKQDKISDDDFKSTNTSSVPKSVSSSEGFGKVGRAETKNEIKSKYTTIKKSIFDESDSDDDLFSTKPLKSTENKIKESASSGINRGNDKNIFKSEPKKITATATATVSRTVKTNRPKSSSLFGDDSDDSDTDLFGNKKVSLDKRRLKTSAVPNSSTTAAASNSSKMADVATNVVTELPSDNVRFKESESKSEMNGEEDTRPSDLTNNNNNNGEKPKSETVTNEVENVSVTVKLRPKSPNVSASDTQADIESNRKSQSQIKKKSIFDDSDSDDDLFKSVTIKLPKKPVSSAPVINDKKEDMDVADNHEEPVTVTQKSNNVDKPKTSSLFGDESDSDSDLFSSKNKPTSTKSKSSSPKQQSPMKEQTPDFPSESTEGINEALKHTEVFDVAGVEATDKVDVNLSKVTVEVDTDLPKTIDEVDTAVSNVTERNIHGVEKLEGDVVKNEESEKVTAKPVGSKISEKIKAMQNSSSESKTEKEEKSQKKDMKPKVSVKSLALNLNINPLALKVGAKPPRLGSASTSTPSTPVGDTEEAPSIGFIATNDEGKLAPTLPIEDKDEKTSKNEEGLAEASSSAEVESPSSSSTPRFLFNDGGDHFVDIIKARPKIQTKRRPPSKRLLKSLVIQETTTDNKDDEKEDEAKIVEEESKDTT